MNTDCLDIVYFIIFYLFYFKFPIYSIGGKKTGHRFIWSLNCFHLLQLFSEKSSVGSCVMRIFQNWVSLFFFFGFKSCLLGSVLQILGTGMDTQDTSPSVLLFFDKQRFIFNAGEVRVAAYLLYEHSLLPKCDPICFALVGKE